ncbi:MAG: Dabb family protein, partial [Chitinophagaceae bacterium]
MSTHSRKKFLTTSAAITAGLAANPLSAFAEGQKKSIIHHVFFWLKNPDSKEDLAKLLAGLETLRKIKEIKKLYIGVPAATEKRDVVDHSYQASELMFFDNLADQKTYQDDPIHQKFIADCSHLWSKVVVYDV